MYNIEKINKIIDDTNRFFSDLKSIGLNEKNISNMEKIHASAMVIFGIMNRVIDLAEEILVKNSLPMPTRYKDSFSGLVKLGVIDAKLSKELENVIEKRNLFAHHYYENDEKSVLKISKDIYVAKDFVEKVKKHVEKSKKIGKTNEI